MRSRVFIQPGQLRYGRFGDGSGTGSSGTFGGGNPLAPWGSNGGRSPAPLQLSEPWTEYTTVSGNIGNANVISNPPWQVSTTPTFSQPVHLIGQGDIHSDDSASRSDLSGTSLSYVTDSLQHVDVTKAIRFKWSMRFQSDPSGFNNGDQFAFSIGGIFSLTINVNCNGGAVSVITSPVTSTFNFTDDFSTRSWQFDLGARNSGGAGKQNVTVTMNGAAIISGTINNLNNGGGGAAFTLSPGFTSRLNNRVFNLFALKLFYVRM